MEIRHLKAFKAVAQELHFGRASQILHIDQSSLSRTISELERELDAKLLLRNRRKTALTKEGQALYKKANQILAGIDVIKPSILAISQGSEGDLRIGISDYMDSHFFSEFLRLYRQKIPQMNIQIKEMSVSEQINGLVRGEFDIGFSASLNTSDNIAVQKVCEDTIVVLLPLRHPLLNKSEISIDDIALYTLIAPHPEFCHGLYQQFSKNFLFHGLTPKISAYTKSYTTMLSLVSSGFGVALAGKTQYLNARSDDVAYRLLSNAFKLDTYLLHRINAPIHHIREIINQIHH